MRVGQIGFWVLAVAGFAFANGASAAVLPGSCQEVLNLQEEAELDSAKVVEIDGATIRSPDQLRAQLASAKGRLPIIKGGEFKGWDFAALLKAGGPICFNQSNLQSTRWDGGRFDGIGFLEAELESASFRGASLRSILLREPHLKAVDMNGADLSDGWLDGGWDGSIEGWRADNAIFVNFTFSCGITLGDGCPMDRGPASFVGADFSGANISTYPFWGQGDYTGALLEGTRFAPNQLLDLKDAQFRGANYLVGGIDEVGLDADEMGQILQDAMSHKTTLDQPSFNCAKASSAAEKLICGDYASELRSLDRRMASLYAMIRPKFLAIAPEQKAWLTKHGKCTDDSCLLSLYEERVAQLLLKIGEQELLAPGTAALFIHDTLELSDNFRSTALFRKITPVLVGASSSEALVTRDRDGSYAIDGEAVGANAHLCSAGGTALRYNPRTGWFSSGKTERAAVFRSYDDRIEFPQNGHPDDAVFPGSSNFVSCGARALLLELRKIDVGADIIQQRRKAYAEGD